MAGGQVVHIVWAYADVLDSVWTSKDAAITRDAELRKENGDFAPDVDTILLNVPDAWGSPTC